MVTPRDGLDRSTLRVLVGIFVAFGVVARAWLLTNPVGGLDSDEAIVGLMARHILEGEVPMYYWGQIYGGPHEPLVTAAFFWVFGSSTLVLKLVAALLSATACVLLWRVGKRVVGEPAATVGALMFWVWPAAFVWWSVKSRGFYHAALVIGLAILLLVLRLAERDSARDMAVLGALVATGMWCTPQTIFFTAPALVWLVVRRVSVLKLAPVGVAGALGGAFPWWVDNLEHGWYALRSSGASFAMPAYGDHLRGFFETGLPGALGLKLADGSRWMVPPVGQAVYVALLAVFTAYVLWELWPGRAARERRGARWLVLLMVIAYPLLFALSPYSWFVAHPRYLYYLTPVCALLLARGLAALRWPALVAGLLVTMTLTTAAFATMRREGTFFPSSEHAVIPQDLGPLFDYLDRRGIDHVYAEYWLAYVVAFESREEVVATPYRGGARHGEADAAVRAAPAPAYLFVKGATAEPVFEGEIAALGIPYEKETVGGFVVYEMDRNVHPESFPAMQSVPQ